MDFFLNFFRPNERLPNWSPTVIWKKDALKLLDEFSAETIPTQTVNDIIKNAEQFPLKFPTDTNKCSFLSTKIQDNVLTKNINSVYPLLHESILNLCANFILYKRKHGSSIEKKYYENLCLKDFINKMLSQRAVSFLGQYDKYKLLNGVEGYGTWEFIGTDQENDLKIQQCMSYDELKLSVFLSVSSYTYFINSGDRKNKGVYQDNRNTVEDNGIIIGMIGPRLAKPEVMEHQEVVITTKQNTNEKGFGTNVKNSVPKLFANFYEEQCFAYNEVVKASNRHRRYLEISEDEIFDNYLYSKRLVISIDTLLIEANSRAKKEEKFAFLHVVGMGLGVWIISPHQRKVYMETFANRIKELNSKLINISDIRFAYIGYEKCGNYEDGKIFPIVSHPNGGIKIHICNKDPHVKLEGADKGKLLVVSYAWDSNALPGNEYWYGTLTTSSDPAAACSTQVCEIHNPHINPLVCADTLRIVTNDGVVTIEEYKESIAKRSKF